MPRRSFPAFVREDAHAHAQHKTLLLLDALQDAHVAAGLVRRPEQSTALKSLYNLLYTPKPFSFALHRASLDIADGVPADIALQFPTTHRVRLFRLCILAVLHEDHRLFQAFVGSGYLRSVNKRLISVFTLFHLCLRSSFPIVRLAVAMDPETKWPNPLFFARPCLPSPAGQGPAPAATDPAAPADSHSDWGAFTLLFRKMSPFYPLRYATYVALLRLKHPARSYAPRDSFVFPLDVACMRNDLVTFNYVAATYPHAVRLSPLAFYFTTSCKAGLKLFYYNNRVPDDSLHYHAMRGNYEMVALLLEVRSELNRRDARGETPAMLSAHSPHTLRLLAGLPGPQGPVPGATPATDVLKNLHWMRRHAWREKDAGSLFHVSNTEKALRFMKKLRADPAPPDVDVDTALVLVLRGVYRDRDVRSHSPVEYLFDAFGGLLKF